MVSEEGKTVFAWNSEAIASLQQGKYAKAMSQLQAATAALRTITQDGRGFRLLPITGYGSQAENDVLEDVAIVSMSTVMPSSGASPEMHSDNEALDTDTNLFRPYGSAFVTPYINYQGVRGLQLTCSLVLYNMALCIHMWEVSKTSGMNSGSNMNAHNLRRALNLYSRSLQVIAGAPGDGRPEEVSLLMLALYNNLGNLHSYLGMIDECRQCLAWVRHLLERHQQLHPDKVQSDIAFFGLNVMSLTDSVFDKAAAA
jgi:hypothetical protein